MLTTMAKRKANPWPAKLRALRARLGLTQEQAAKRIKVSTGAWGGWESGLRQPSEQSIFLIQLLSEEKI